MLMQHVGDLFVELAGDDQVRHLAFALGQLVRRRETSASWRRRARCFLLRHQALADEAQQFGVVEGLLE